MFIVKSAVLLILAAFGVVTANTIRSRDKALARMNDEARERLPAGTSVSRGVPSTETHSGHSLATLARIIGARHPA